MSQHEPIPISINDVAQAAGVSATTVSLVLRGMGNISSKTRDHVRKVSEKLGYRPNLAASLLARQSHDHVVPDIPVALLGMGGKTFGSVQFLQSFSRSATQMGFQVIEPEPDSYTNLSNLFRVLYHRGVRGVIMNHNFDSRQISPEDAARFSFLSYGQSLKDHRFHQVCTEIFESTRMLWEMIWERGYRRIGAALCRHREDLHDDFAREDAVIGCQLRHNAPSVPLFTGDHNDYAGIVRWVKEVKPDALIVFNSAINAPLIEAGFRIPEDIAVASLHLNEVETHVTGLFQDLDELARVAARQMESMICHNEIGFPPCPHALLVAPKFKEGETLPYLPSSVPQAVLK